MLEEMKNNIDYGFGPTPMMAHDFWKRLKREIPSNSITWNSPRSKRNTEKLPHFGPNDFMNHLKELFHPEVGHLHVKTVKREVNYEVMGQERYVEIMETDPHFPQA